MIVLVSLIVLLRRFPCFNKISHGSSYPHSMIFSLVFSINFVLQVYTNIMLKRVKTGHCKVLMFIYTSAKTIQLTIGR